MQWKYFSVAVAAVVLSWAAAAHADNVVLFLTSDPNDLQVNYYAPPSNARIRGQHFKPSLAQPTRLGTLDTFNTAGFYVQMDVGSTSYTLELFHWVGSYSSSTTQGNMIASAVNVPVNSFLNDWVSLSFADQPADAEYFLRITVNSAVGWSLWGTAGPVNNNLAYNQAYNGSGGVNREFQLQLAATGHACTTPQTQINSVSGLYGLSGMHDTGSPTASQGLITFQGTNLQYLSSVYLQKTRDGGAVIPGSLAMQPDGSLQVTLDLTDAEGGRYDIFVTHPCEDISPFPSTYPVYQLEGFLVYMGTPTNGSFETGLGADNVAPLCDPARVNGTNPKPLHWDMNRGPVFGGFKRDGSYAGPGCDPATHRAFAITGDHYAGIDINATNDARDVSFFQTIDGSSLVDGTGQLTADFNVRAELAPNIAPTVTGVVSIRILDGDENGPLLASTPLMPLPLGTGNGFFFSPDYNAVVVAASAPPLTSNPKLLTIEVRMTLDANTVSGGAAAALWVDNVRTGPYVIPGCHTPWADANGDGSVDMADFGILQTCLTSGFADTGHISDSPVRCSCFDRNGDLTIDDRDVTSFLNCATGPGVPTVACP